MWELVVSVRTRRPNAEARAHWHKVQREQLCSRSGVFGVEPDHCGAHHTSACSHSGAHHTERYASSHTGAHHTEHNASSYTGAHRCAHSLAHRGTELYNGSADGCANNTSAFNSRTRARVRRMHGMLGR
jgi:hypothetical protein